MRWQRKGSIRWILTIIVLLAVVTGVLVLLNRSALPTYRGKPITHWERQLALGAYGNRAPADGDAIHAFKAMGRPAAVYLNRRLVGANRLGNRLSRGVWNLLPAGVQAKFPDPALRRITALLALSTMDQEAEPAWREVLKTARRLDVQQRNNPEHFFSDLILGNTAIPDPGVMKYFLRTNKVWSAGSVTYFTRVKPRGDAATVQVLLEMLPPQYGQSSLDAASALLRMEDVDPAGEQMLKQALEEFSGLAKFAVLIALANTGSDSDSYLEQIRVQYEQSPPSERPQFSQALTHLKAKERFSGE